MSHRVRWIDSGGGPLILLAEELLSSWRGIEGWRDHRDALDHSNYARACRAAENWLGLIGCGGGKALILGGEPGQVAWLPNIGRAGGALVQWVYADNENDLLTNAVGPVVRNALNAPSIEKAELLTGPSGVMRLFDSAQSGDDIHGASQMLALEPGQYLVRAAYVKAARFAMVVREIAICRC